MYDFKIFAKNEKERKSIIQTIRIYSQDKGMEFRIENYPMLMTKNRKEKKRNNRGNRIAYLAKPQNT